ncbi:hypothetical protein, partial [Longispora fulva]|uniref:hypothetical protein n=2 Tax=Bacteria TaxID=2 RepID=UPI00363E0A91
MIRRKKINFFIERKISAFLLWSLTIIFLFIAVKTSNEEIIDILKDTSIEDLLQQFSRGNEFLKNISLGFLISL